MTSATRVQTEDHADYITGNRHAGQDRLFPGFTDAELKIMRQACAILRNRDNMKGAHPLTSPDLTRTYLIAEQAGKGYEVFSVMFLDTRHRVIAFEDLFTGTIDAAHVHPRVVVERAINLRAAAVILSHNHPSGVPEPSQGDLAITRRLRDALGLVDVRLLDHFIAADGGCVSLADRGLV